MNIPNRGADLRVAVGVDVLLKKIHETTIPLQDREDPQVRPGRNAGKERFDPRREIKLGQDPPEGLEGQ
jgi:hypothetical protein